MAELYSSDPMVNARNYYDVLKKDDRSGAHKGQQQNSSLLFNEKRPHSSSRGKHVCWSDEPYAVQQRNHVQDSSTSSSVSDGDMTTTTLDESVDRYFTQSEERNILGQQQDTTLQNSKENELMDLTTQTENLFQRNQQTLKELEDLRLLTDQFLDEVMKNPGNERVAEIWANLKAQGKA